jgi:hypothetical protein
LIAGAIATALDTKPLRQFSSSSSNRRASPLKFPATAVDPYKLKPPPAPQGHHTPSHHELASIVRQSSWISNFPQIKSLPPKEYLAAASVNQVSLRLLLPRLNILMTP